MVMGRPVGSRNRLSIAREEAAKAEIARAVKAAAGRGTEPRSALDDMYRISAEVEAITSLIRKRAVKQNGKGVVLNHEHLPAYGQWLDRKLKCAELLAKYQLPPIKAMDAPTPPPSQDEIERGSKVVFGLRVFEGNREGQALQILGPEEDDE